LVICIALLISLLFSGLAVTKDTEGDIYKRIPSWFQHLTMMAIFCWSLFALESMIIYIRDIVKFFKWVYNYIDKGEA
jgi:hypothetical protein